MKTGGGVDANVNEPLIRAFFGAARLNSGKIELRWTVAALRGLSGRSPYVAEVGSGLFKAVSELWGGSMPPHAFLEMKDGQKSNARIRFPDPADIKSIEVTPSFYSCTFRCGCPPRCLVSDEAGFVIIRRLLSTPKEWSGYRIEQHGSQYVWLHDDAEPYVPHE